MSSNKKTGLGHRLTAFFKTVGQNPSGTLVNMDRIDGFKEIKEFLNSTAEMRALDREKPEYESSTEIETDNKKIVIERIKETDPEELSLNEQREIRRKNLQYRSKGLVVVPQGVKQVFGEAHNMINHNDTSFYLIGDKTWSRRNMSKLEDSPYEEIIRYDKICEKILSNTADSIIEQVGRQVLEDYLKEYFPIEHHRKMERRKKFVEESYLLSEALGKDEIYMFLEENDSKLVEEYAREIEDMVEFSRDYDGLGEITVGGHPGYVPAYERVRRKLRTQD